MVWTYGFTWITDSMLLYDQLIFNNIEITKFCHVIKVKDLILTEISQNKFCFSLLTKFEKYHLKIAKY